VYADEFAAGRRLKNRQAKEGSMKLVVSEFVTLDGVMEDPGGAESLDRGGWAFRFDRGADGDAFKLAELMEAEALLLGAATYRGFAAAWPGRSDEQGFADRMNSMPKLVVSTTVTGEEWENTTVLSGDVAGEIAKLRDREGGNLLVAGSRQLVQLLVAHDLVDELRLMIFPVVLGAGKRLFEEGQERAYRPLELRRSAEVALLTLGRR
jgi:dihydrofolate reductase